MAPSLTALFRVLRSSIPYYRTSLLTGMNVAHLISLAVEALMSYQAELIREVCSFLESAIVACQGGDEGGVVGSTIQEFTSPIIQASVSKYI